MALVRSAQGAFSSNRTSHSPCSYHVFLSFRGEDTRKTFTDHLYTAFVSAGFRTFRDDYELERGEEIQPEFLKAIHQSRCSVIVFSKDYASSRWCLNELLMILERKRTSDHVVLPVFYDVDPSDVRKQTGSLAKAFARHQNTQSFDTVKGWREALTEAADLAGMVLQNEPDGHESKFIKKIVKVIEDKLRRTPLGVEPYLLGIHSRAKNINLWLQDGSNDVGVFVIYGMRGIGKTTIAKFVYNLNFRRFESGSFLENIREISEQSNGLIRLQKQLLHDISKGRKVTIHSISEGKAKIEDAVSSKSVLLVLDDVDHMDQLDGVLGMQDRFHPGSKIIITTSYAGLLNVHHHDFKFDRVETLDSSDSLVLFSLHAFGQEHPNKSYINLSRRLVQHCGGLPLALKILGSSLSGKNMSVWESALTKLEAIPDGEIMKKLKISYDSLQDSHDQDLFLHIACFFIGMDKDVIVRILDDCGFFTGVGIENLIDRYLVRIDKNNKMQMHNMIRDLGRGIVQLESKEPGERSRIWRRKDSFKVLTENNGTQTIEGLVLNMQLHPAYTPSRNSNDRVVLETNAFSRMHKLRLLQLSYVQLNGSYKDFPTGLRWLCWYEFPFDSLPSSFPLKTLVALEMCYSRLRQVWKGTEYLPSLKILNLSHSVDLIRTPGFSPVPNLEMLILKGCASLVDVHESIGSLERLVYLSMKDCKSIRKLPESISMLTSLETLIISGCSNLNVFPVEIKRIESLKVFQADGVPIHQLLTVVIEEATLWPRKNIGISWASYLPSNLVDLSLSKCKLSDEDFPKDFGNLCSLQILDLSSNPICSLPDCIRGARGLRKLSFEGCKMLKSLVRLPNVGELIILNCYSLEKVTFQSLSDSRISVTLDSNFKLVEVEYWYKLEPIDRVGMEMINVLELNNLKSSETILMEITSPFSAGRRMMLPIQGLYEYGIFSTFLPGNYDIPGSFSHKSRGSAISLTVPLLPNPKIQGLNFFCVYANSNDSPEINVNINDLPYPLIMKVSNKSKGLKWIYGPTFLSVPSDGEETIWLSHWKFGNKLEGGDEVTFTVLTSMLQVKEWGIKLVYYEQEEKMNPQHNTMEPSYPCVIAGDLSCNCLVPGTYLLFPVMDLSISDMLNSAWFSYLSGDFDEITEKEEEQKGDCTLAEQRGSNNNNNSHSGRCWKVVMIMATVFFLSLPLVSRSPHFRPKK